MTFGTSRVDARVRAEELIDGLDLSGKERAKVSVLSGGQRRRLDVAMGLMHAPDLLVLDEPSTGLDPHNRANLWEHISALRAGATSHPCSPPTTSTRPTPWPSGW